MRIFIHLLITIVILACNYSFAQSDGPTQAKPKRGINEPSIEETELYIASGDGDLDKIIELWKTGVEFNGEQGPHGTALIHALRTGNVNAVVLLCVLGADINEMNRNGYGALHTAVGLRDIEFITLLAKLGANPNIRDEYSATPIYRASILQLYQHDDQEQREEKTAKTLSVIDSLVSIGADVNLADNQGNTPLYLAMKYSPPEIASKLLSLGAVPGRPSMEDPTELHMAAEKGYIELIRPLLNAGVSLEALNDWEYTPLLTAIHFEHPDIALLLLASGANGLHQTSYGISALSLACREGYLDLMLLLIEQGADVNIRTDDGYTPLHGVCTRIHMLDEDTRYVMMKNLLDRGANPNVLADGNRWPKVHWSELEQGNTPLHSIASHGTAEQVRLLVSHGANLYQLDADGRTALERAAQWNNEEVVNALLTAGSTHNLASATLQDDSQLLTRLLNCDETDVCKAFGEGYTALHIAARGKHHRMAKLLITHGADPNFTGECGVTPLLRCSDDDLPMIELLIKAGADPTITTESGYSALHKFSTYGNGDALSLLIPYFDSLDIKTNTRGTTPLMEAVSKGNQLTAEILLNAGADPNLQNTKGKTALHMSSHQYQMTKLLLEHGADPGITDSNDQKAYTSYGFSNLSKDELAELNKMAGLSD